MTSHRKSRLIVVWLAILGALAATFYFRTSIPWGYLFRLSLWLAFLGVIIKMQFQVRDIVQRMSREQQQDLVNRGAALAEIKRTADALARRTETIAQAVKEDANVIAKAAEIARDDLKAAIVETKAAIEENTEITRYAADTVTKVYEGGNHVNDKKDESSQ